MKIYVENALGLYQFPRSLKQSPLPPLHIEGVLHGSRKSQIGDVRVLGGIDQYNFDPVRKKVLYGKKLSVSKEEPLLYNIDL
eukprot:snap_masked-scaffold_6-processed-gene-20.42-mRNA-1 protein AED:1.00 eAED:1.00 QI:0/-1/0/0/-1/1/1/0/81